MGLTANVQTNYIETKIVFIKFDSFSINFYCIISDKLMSSCHVDAPRLESKRFVSFFCGHKLIVAL